MVAVAEIPWQDRLKLVDFTIIQAQIARARGIPLNKVSELDVRARMQEISLQDERATRILYPQDRPVRSK